MRKMDWLLKSEGTETIFIFLFSLLPTRSLTHWVLIALHEKLFENWIFWALQHERTKASANEPHKLNYFFLLQTFSSSPHIKIEQFIKEVSVHTHTCMTRSYRWAYYRFKIASTHFNGWHYTEWWENFVFFFLLLPGFLFLFTVSVS